MAKPQQELARRSFAGAMVYFAVTVVVILATPYPREHPALIFSVSGLLLCLGVVRMIEARRILSGKPSRPFRFTVVSTFVVFGFFSGATVMLYQIQFADVLVLVSAACLSAGATSSLCADLRLVRICISAIVFPVVASFLLLGGAVGWSMGFLAAVYMVFLLAQGQQHHRVYWEAVQAGELFEAKQEAELLAEAKSELLARMSHEVRTPLNGVIGMLEVMLQGGLPREQAERAKLCHTAALNLFSVLNSILEYSRVESGTIQLENIEFELCESIRLALAPLAQMAKDKGLDFQSHYRSGMDEHYLGDPVRIQQVITNLVSNAIKFTSAGSVRVEAECFARETVHDWIRVTVSDTGIGMTEQARKKLFTPYAQTESYIARVYGGTGLGLAISGQLARLLGGSIDVESWPGEGSTFCFVVPLERCMRPSIEKLSQAVAHRTARPESVLVVEDNVANQWITLQLLKDLGFEADLTLNGEEAVEAAARKEYALILMDCQLPQLDGFSAARRIRGLEGGKNNSARILAVSSEALPEDRERACAAGMDGFLSRPFTLAQLARAIDDVLEKKVRAGAR